MRIKTLVRFEDEVTVDVSADDILGMFCEAETFDSRKFMNIINAVAAFLNGVPIEYIESVLKASQRETISKYLQSQAQRYEVIV